MDRLFACFALFFCFDVAVVASAVFENDSETAVDEQLGSPTPMPLKHFCQSIRLLS